MTHVKLAFAALLLAATFPQAAVSQSGQNGRTLSEAELVGEPVQGEIYAENVCAGCHGVGRGMQDSPVPAATPFQTIANTPGITSRALTVWLTTFHPERTMPSLVVAPEDRQDLIAYILSLRNQ